jgi:hypothetical protein
MGGTFRIAIDLGTTIPAGAPVSRDTLPHLAYALARIAEAAQQQWVSYAQGKEALPNGKVIQSRTGEYARSILLRDAGEFAAEVYSDLAYALVIEEGAPRRDLKELLGSSLKVRVSSKGTRYLIIPFRHNHPNSVLGNNMPRAVHEWWNGREASHITGTFERPSGTGAYDIKTRRPVMVPGWRYHWGDRLGKSDLAGLGVAGKTAQRLEGMVMFRRPLNEGGGHSQFITFRTMSENSKGWIVPPRPGLHPAKVTADKFRPIAEREFGAAVEQDIRVLLGGR